MLFPLWRCSSPCGDALPLVATSSDSECCCRLQVPGRAEASVPGCTDPRSHGDGDWPRGQWRHEDPQHPAVPGVPRELQQGQSLLRGERIAITVECAPFWRVRLQHTSPLRNLSTLRLRYQVPKINTASAEQLHRAMLLLLLAYKNPCHH